MDCNHNREWGGVNPVWLAKLALISISANPPTTRNARLRATPTDWVSANGHDEMRKDRIFNISTCGP